MVKLAFADDPIFRATYQALGCWTPHVEITRPAYEVTLDVFEHFGTLKERYAYEQVCALPPGDAG